MDSASERRRDFNNHTEHSTTSKSLLFFNFDSIRDRFGSWGDLSTSLHLGSGERSAGHRELRLGLHQRENFWTYNRNIIFDFVLADGGKVFKRYASGCTSSTADKTKGTRVQWLNNPARVAVQFLHFSVGNRAQFGYHFVCGNDFGIEHFCLRENIPYSKERAFW
jgi:hypothetical protein